MAGARASRERCSRSARRTSSSAASCCTPIFGEQLPYQVDGYLSPLFSPLIAPDWLPTWISPGLFILWVPARLPGHLLLLPQGLLPVLLRRPARAAPWPSPSIHRRYRLEAALPFILQNLHRFFLYLAFVPLFFLWVDASLSLREGGQWRIGLGVVILVVNAALLSGYSLSCHSLRHLVGGKIDCFSCTRRDAGPVQRAGSA